MKLSVKKGNEFKGHKDSLYALCRGEANAFYSSGGDGLIVKWNLDTPDAAGKVIAQVGSAVYCLLYLEEKDHLLAGTRSGEIFLFDLGNNAILKQAKGEGEIFCIAKNGNHIIAGSASGSLYLYDENLNLIRERNISDKSCRTIIFINETTIATGWSDNHIRIIDLPELKIVKAFEAHLTSVFSLAFIRGKYLLSGGRDARLKIWDIKDYSLMLEIPAHWFAINDIKLSPDGKYFATASRDKTVKIWDAGTFELLKVLDNEKSQGHTHSVNILLWMNDSCLLSAGDDRKIDAWQIA